MDHSSTTFDLRQEVESLLQLVETNSRHRQSSDALDGLQRLERCLSHLEALRADLLLEAADPEPRVEEFTVESADESIPHTPRTVVIEDAVREEIAASLRVSNAHAGSLIENARRLHADLPATLSALRGGAISGRHASVIVEWTGKLSARQSTHPDARIAFAQACAAFEERVLRVARRGTSAQTRAAAKRTLSSLDKAGTAQRRQQQRRLHDVRIIDESDGVSVLLAHMATPAARAVLDSVARESDSIGDESLSVGQKRAQALTSLVLGAVAPQVRLDVVLPAMGENSASVGRPDDCSSTTAEEDAMGRIVDAMLNELGNATIDGAEIDTADLLALLADPTVSVTLRKLVADPVTGVLSGCGRNSYRLPERLREFIIRRDAVCRFSGCRRSAHVSQIDHAQAWDDGGATDPDNLGALCTRHHQLKTHAGWQIEDSRVDGYCNWISPQGRRYRHYPEALVEVPLEHKFARIVGAALSSAPPTGEPPGGGRWRSPNVPNEYTPRGTNQRWRMHMVTPDRSIVAAFRPPGEPAPREPDPPF